jgi:uncharacterized protein (TIGR00255 family)
MIHSMTGFARQELTHGSLTYSLELKAVNHRYFELSVKLPEDIRPLEANIRSLLGKHIKRGKVDLWVNAKSTTSSQGALTIDQPALSQLLQLIKALQNEAGQQGVDLRQPSVLDTLKWPGVVQEPNPAQRPSDELVVASLTQLLEQFNQHRQSEGARLNDFIMERLDQLETHVLAVRARLPEIHSKLRNRLLEKLASVSQTVSISNERFEQELLLQLQKMDVEEELNRLSGHRLEIIKALNGSEAAGRRLDFLMQELNREANTLAAKSADADTTRLAVDMKVLIEQMREQVQNIE